MKKIITRIWIIIIAVFLVYYNIKANSVYYAKNTVGENNQHFVLSTVMKNLKNIDLENINGLRFDFDGNITIRDGNGLMISTGKIYYVFSVSDVDYLLDTNLNIIDATEMPSLKDYKIDDNERIVVQSKISELLQPIIDNQKKPLINLQWLFNLIYQNQFK